MFQVVRKQMVRQGADCLSVTDDLGSAAEINCTGVKTQRRVEGESQVTRRRIEKGNKGLLDGCRPDMH
jgi:hypothetical protein